MTDQQQIIDDSDLRKYRTEIPNMADDELNPFEYRLYGHYKRVCGAKEGGLCYESVRTTAEITQIGMGYIVDVRHDLATKGWIEIHKADDSQMVIVTIVDRWLENFLRFTAPDKLESLMGNRSYHEQSGTNDRSYSGDKEVVVVADFNSLNLYQEIDQHQQQLSSDVVSSSLDSRLIYLISDHGLDVKQKQLADWCNTYGTEIVVEVARWYVHGRQTGQVRGASWMRSALANEYGYPPPGFDHALYLTSEERKVIEEAEEARRLAEVEEWERNQEETNDSLLVNPPQHEPVMHDPAYYTIGGQHFHTIWETAYGQLQLQMPREAFDTWLRGAKLIAMEKSPTFGSVLGIANVHAQECWEIPVFVLGVPNTYAQAWLEHRLKKVIVRALRQIAEQDVDVEFVLWAEHRNGAKD